MLGIGPGEMVLIAVVALVVIGPEKFPEFAKIALRTFRDLRGYMDDVKGELRKELQPVKKEIDQVSKYKPEDYIDAMTGETAKDDKPLDYDKKNDPYGYAAQEAAQGAAQEEKPKEASSAASSSSEWDEFADAKPSSASADPSADAGASADTGTSDDAETSTDSAADASAESSTNHAPERLDG